MLGFDRFTFTQSKSGCIHSSDVLSFNITNLPIQLRDGIVVLTPRFLQGHLCQAVLIAGCMNHIALCKASAMVGHASQNDFCTKCKATHDVLSTSKGLKDIFPHRTGEENRKFAFLYRKIDNEDGKQSFFNKHGVAYTELAQLPYFDMFEMPFWVGQLPSHVNYPAAGSLSADEYKSLVLIYLPAIIPFIWSEWQPVAAKEHEAALKKWRQKGRQTDLEPKIRMHENELSNFLKLTASLKILLGCSVCEVDIECAKTHLLEYLQGYQKASLQVSSMSCSSDL
ncbi:hypothetical protein A7U60_g8097 [Sanghuangporus baumii]|uniref:Uncharacterized protein n=1 Tax=Sanghuangporus baumii TaxID=108892 RepID=A0A9Q5HS20_SANBA|nr:hypothetical protein A7U60_g8097 [Sanghuangporus baumii]